MRKALMIALVLLIASGAAFANGGSDDGGKMADEITIHWAQWAPADYLQQLSGLYTEETGVEVVVEQTPWETFVQKYNVEMIARSDAWDIIIGDSQDLGNMAINGHYVELTDWVIEKEVDKNFTAASMASYSEYPAGSGQYWGVPAEGDALGFAYRKDLFEDPDNMAAFEAEYGYKLDIPADIDAMRDIAEFFHDPDNGFYGISIYGDNGYDSLVMFAEQMIWSYGAELGNYATNEVDGYLNTPAAADGINMYKELFSFTPPAFNDAFFVKANDAFTAGIVPMTCNFFAFLPALANEATSPYANDTGYFPVPPQVGRDGVERQSAALGGQGASVVTYSKKQDTAMSWMDWFIQEDVQLEWASLGGYSCHIETLESDEFLNAAPYNPAFAVTLNIMKDFWNVPPYGEMLESFSRLIGNFIIRGNGTAEEALQATTEEWEAILSKL
ncbi:MAG: extracellular solute-binding protein [Spirochaetaceae bacterium]|nr:extracellular solute-binding protein [Spirochaetaceae bacterium]